MQLIYIAHVAKVIFTLFQHLSIIVDTVIPGWCLKMDSCLTGPQWKSGNKASKYIHQSKTKARGRWCNATKMQYLRTCTGRRNQ